MKDLQPAGVDEGYLDISEGGGEVIHGAGGGINNGFSGA